MKGNGWKHIQRHKRFLVFGFYIGPHMILSMLVVGGSVSEPEMLSDPCPGCVWVIKLSFQFRHLCWTVLFFQQKI